MSSSVQKTPSQSVWTWILITLLWGSVFFATSSWILTETSIWYDGGVFSPDIAQTLRVYAMYVPALLVVALSAMAIQSRLDPDWQKQRAREKAVRAGSREQLFVSFAASIATSSLFTVLTAFAYALSSPLIGTAVGFSVKSIVVAAGLNIAAGLAASLFVGVIFLVSGVAKGSRKV